MENAQWYLIETEEEYETALSRYDEVKYSAKGSQEHKEKMLLVHLITQYESLHDIEVEVDPVEVIKIRMEDFGYKPADLAQVYGDKGTVSKVLNYKQALSLSMIRKFSQLLRIPVEMLIREYPLKSV
ncbi:HTH-type transcriptional regulator / antitoxin HigA [Dyadobacter soli]|uniref:HTH-type transcriptional regulator / antitoxin HigA n=1 Tax=Dyadobacter soli TaxID=659014 RepID=A0A1G7P1U2_9BACT|nr:XRE family transcriptional regulator [Dyadobacter soli]SDF80194.1 HTH-type transcriptional regulator / antitoxin HigA [Dyadobacter soli]